jgi:hypothetical protein
LIVNKADFSNGKGAEHLAKAAFMAISGQGLFLSLFLYIFTKQFDLNGLIISQFITELCAFLLSISLGLSKVKNGALPLFPVKISLSYQNTDRARAINFSNNVINFK